LDKAPATFKTIKSNTKNDKNLQYKIQVYIEDCTGCGNCINSCLGNKGVKAIEFRKIGEERAAGENDNVAFFEQLPDNVTDGTQITQYKGTQFRQPLFEFSGACEGCGETPYIKLVTQLFGERMLVANATGCSSIYGGTFPTIPYCTTKEGKGPAWGNSLFEDNAEYGYGFRLAVDANRNQLKSNVQRALGMDISSSLKDGLNKSLSLWNKVDDEAQEAARKVKLALSNEVKNASGEKLAVIRKIIELQDYFVDKSVWAFGGDGWAYDIGYGGLDHVLAMNKNVNVLVLDTEVYSNTGGQASKSTPIASIARFAEAGKRTTKKDLGLIFMSYGYIYVASISLGANMNQAVKALLEAEAYDGPSLVIAYSPCINHGLAKGMGTSIAEEKLAVNAGYWPLYRYNPDLAKEGKNPFVYESKDPTVDMMEFLMNETRYKALKQLYPDVADELYKLALEDKKKKHAYYKKLSEMQF
jgi:pyruvate-ferredoxin/flavodoxin oxidoreductase